MTVVRDNDRFPLWREFLYGKGLSMVVWTIHRNIDKHTQCIQIYANDDILLSDLTYISEESRRVYPKRLAISTFVRRQIDFY